MPDVFVPPPPRASESRGEKPVAPPVPPVETTVATVLVPAVRIPTRRYLERAASASRPQEIGASSSSALDTEATSATPVGWVRGGGAGTLNEASLDVQAKLQAEAVALKRCNEAYLESRTAIRVSRLLVSSPSALLFLFHGDRKSVV